MTLRDFVRSVSLRPLTVALAAGNLLAIPISPSRADVEITARQSTGATGAPPQTIKLFYKGSNARLEIAGRPVLLYDGKTGIIHTLDTAHRTYYTTFVTEMQQAADPVPPGMSRQIKEDAKLDLRRTDQTMTLAGVTARQYLLTGSITFSRNQPQGFRGGGGRGSGRRRGGRGGFPGGGFPGGGFPGGFLRDGATPLGEDGEDGAGGRGGYGGRGGSPPALPQWSLSGEVWLADKLTFPTKEDALPAAQIVAASAGPFLQPLADALGKHKGLPLLARITVTRTPADGASGAEPSSPVSTATTLTVESLSSGALDDRLFQAPLDYTLTPSPQAPYVPGATGK